MFLLFFQNIVRNLKIMNFMIKKTINENQILVSDNKNAVLG